MAPYHVVMPAHGTTNSNLPPPSRESNRARIMNDTSSTKNISRDNRRKKINNNNSNNPGRSSRVTSPLPDQHHTPELMVVSSKMDGPFQRAKDEWKDPMSWFGIEDCGRLLDIPSSFGSTHTIFKWVIWLWMFPTLLYLWTSHPNGAWFLGTLEHWSFLLSVIYASMSLVNAHITPTQPAVATEGVNLYLRIFWIIFELAAHLEALTTFLFWTITVHMLAEQEDGYQFDYGTFVMHGAALAAVWFDGMVLNRIPVRIKHFFICLAVDALFVAWTIIHAAAGWSNGTAEVVTTSDMAGQLAPEEASESIYVVLNWQDESVQALFVALLVLFVIAPILFIFQWIMSLYTCPCTWNGLQSRRCIDIDTSSSANIRGITGRNDEESPSHKNRGPSYTRTGDPHSETSRSSSRRERPTSPRERPTSPRERPTTPRPTTPRPRRESSRAMTPTPSSNANRKSKAARANNRANTPDSSITPNNSNNDKGNWWEGSNTPPPPPSDSAPTASRKGAAKEPNVSAAKNGKRRKRRSTSVPKDKIQERSTPKRQNSSMDIA